MRLIFLIGLAASLGILALVIEFSRRDLLDRNSFFIGLTASIGLGFFSVMPEFLRIVTRLLNLEYTYVLTSTVGILALLILNVYTLARLVGTQRKLNNLAQEVAIEN
jgi:hypothetical protein